MITTLRPSKRTQKRKAKVHFGMNLTSDERQQITLFAKSEGKSAKAAIMMLVEKALQQTEPPKLSARELMKLSPGEKNRIMAKQFQQAAQWYQENPGFIVPDVDPVIDS